jgi:hypothetical protein
VAAEIGEDVETNMAGDEYIRHGRCPVKIILIIALPTRRHPWPAGWFAWLVGFVL